MSLQLQDPCLVCSDCKGSLMSSSLTLPRHSLANDLWMGEQLSALRGLASATKRLLPMTRACMQVVVLQPGHLSREERQHGFVGNSIFLPQAKPSSVLTTLPPKDVDMQDAVLFVLVGSQKDAVKGSSLLRAPRDEYTAAVECLRKRILSMRRWNWEMAVMIFWRAVSWNCGGFCIGAGVAAARSCRRTGTDASDDEKMDDASEEKREGP